MPRRFWEALRPGKRRAMGWSARSDSYPISKNIGQNSDRKRLLNESPCSKEEGE